MVKAKANETGRKSAPSVAEDIQNTLRKSGKDVITFSWPEFYVASGRERIKDAFWDELETSLRGHALMIKAGQSVVLVAKDFRFAPPKG